MADQTAGQNARYWAFISYSHKDAAFGRRLHRRLENYAVPHRLVGRTTAMGIVPKKLVPIFRDREELPAANDLSTEVRAALKISHSLIVVCSPAAAASNWVSREIEVFRELHPERPVLAVLRNGEPPDCFPHGLLAASADGGMIEPLAADFRPGQDGDQLGLLKLVAGIVGVRLDELIQRDAARRNRRVTAVTAGALTAMLIMGVLTAYALSARTEAEHQRREAEGLVEYMLTDLRDRLKSVGRLDVMQAVNERAFHYYAGQDLDRLSPESLGRNARLLQAMGDDDMTRGDYEKALTKIREAYRITSTLLAKEPNDPDRIFDHAQSEFYLGKVDYSRRRYVSAQSHFKVYKQLADRLAVVAPRDPRSVQETGYAEGNLCTTALALRKEFASAVQLCSTALKDMEKAARHSPSMTMTGNLVNRHSWLASAYLAYGDHEHATSELKLEDGLLDNLLNADPMSAINKRLWVSMQRQSAWIEAQMGKKEEAKARLSRAAEVVDGMIRYEPNDKTVRELREKIDRDNKQIDALPAQRGKQ